MRMRGACEVPAHTTASSNSTSAYRFTGQRPLALAFIQAFDETEIAFTIVKTAQARCVCADVRVLWAIELAPADVGAPRGECAACSYTLFLTRVGVTHVAKIAIAISKHGSAVSLAIVV